MNESIQKKQIEKIKALKQGRDNNIVSESLLQLKKSAKGTENIIPYILKSVENYATLGEIAGSLRNVWGEY